MGAPACGTGHAPRPMQEAAGKSRFTGKSALLAHSYETAETGHFAACSGPRLQEIACYAKPSVVILLNVEPRIEGPCSAAFAQRSGQNLALASEHQQAIIVGRLHANYVVHFDAVAMLHFLEALAHGTTRQVRQHLRSGAWWCGRDSHDHALADANLVLFRRAVSLVQQRRGRGLRRSEAKRQRRLRSDQSANVLRRDTRRQLHRENRGEQCDKCKEGEEAFHQVFLAAIRLSRKAGRDLRRNSKRD